MAPIAWRAACCFGDENNVLEVEAVFAAFSSREFEPGKTYCCRGETVYAQVILILDPQSESSLLTLCVCEQPKNATAPLTNNVQGKIAVIDRGVNTFFEKVHHAANAGAIGVVFVDNNDRLMQVPENVSSMSFVSVCFACL